jgi:hypothetical protein
LVGYVLNLDFLSSNGSFSIVNLHSPDIIVRIHMKIAICKLEATHLSDLRQSETIDSYYAARLLRYMSILAFAFNIITIGIPSFTDNDECESNLVELIMI